MPSSLYDTRNTEARFLDFVIKHEYELEHGSQNRNFNQSNSIKVMVVKTDQKNGGKRTHGPTKKKEWWKR